MSSKYLEYSNCNHLNSESTAALKKFTKNSPQELQTNNHSYSQSCLQNLSNADSLKTIFISKESIHVVKLNTLRKRMIITLNGIESLLGDRPQPDGVEDLKRRQQRAAEFSSRFGRNYLYPLQRQMNIIAKMWKNVSLNHTHSAYFSLCQKVIATHQNAHLALQAYLSHMPCSVEKGVPDKLEELLQVVINLCSLCSKLDMSEGDSDFNSKKVRQQCQQLVLQIKAEVIVEDGESYTAVSHTCPQKEITSIPKKEDVSQRFSMYSRNSHHTSSNNHNRKAAKILASSRKKPIKSHCNRQPVKEPSDTTNCNQRNIHGKPTDQITHEKGIEEGSEIGEVCASDDVRTMMEFFLPDEVPILSDSSSKKAHSRRKTSTFLKELDKQSLPSFSTLKKLESEIKNLKKQTNHLKEMGHPNYSIYIKVLETMNRQLSGMKSKKHIPNTSSVHKTKPKQIVNRELDTKFPKNVKLICLSSEADYESINTTQNELVTLDSSAHNDREMHPIDTLQYEFPQPSAGHGKRSKRNKTQLNVSVQVNDWKPQDIGKVYELNNMRSVSKCFLDCTETHSDQNAFEASTEVQHPNTPNTSFSGNDRGLDNCKDCKPTSTGIESKLTMSEHDISSVIAYRQKFQDCINSNSLYRESVKTVVSRLSSHIIDNILEEITLNDTGIQKITSGLLQLEFQ